MANCTLQIAPPFGSFWLRLDALGAGQRTLLIPNRPAWRCAVLNLHGLVLPTASPPANLDLTNALKWTFGL